MNTSNTSITINCEFDWIVYEQLAHESGIGNILFVSNTKEIAEDFIKENFPNYSCETIFDSSLRKLFPNRLEYLNDESPFMIVLAKTEPFQGVVGPE